jgi:hypothetical protein
MPRPTPLPHRRGVNGGEWDCIQRCRTFTRMRCRGGKASFIVSEMMNDPYCSIDGQDTARLVCANGKLTPPAPSPALPAPTT